uniref:Uncharacterized protein n=1 Tax=Oryza meridionalis TaxID=40149 RepID=A0A0E0E065_9ORYZ
MPHPLPQAPPRPIRRSIAIPPPCRSPTCSRLLCLKCRRIRFVVAPPSLRLALTLSFCVERYDVGTAMEAELQVVYHYLSGLQAT